MKNILITTQHRGVFFMSKEELNRPEIRRTPPAEKVQLKVTRDPSDHIGSSMGWWAGRGDENDMHGKTIQEAIECFMEWLQEERASKADPNDEEFEYTIPFSWT